MSFHDVRFPIEISRGASGGPERRTDVVVLGSGHEERNARWADSRRRYNAGYGVRSLDDLNQVIAFFEARRGQLYGFRWRDPMDWKSCLPSATPSATDVELGIGDAATDTFALVKPYVSGEHSWTRDVRKPIIETLQVAVDGTLQSPATAYAFDDGTGAIVFQQGHVPDVGQIVTAGFAFDVPVRFDTDTLEINLSHFHAGSIPSIPIAEVRL